MGTGSTGRRTRDRRGIKPRRHFCRGEQLATTLPIRRVVEPADVAALAPHLMTNTALTGATYDVDGGQQLIP